MHATLNKGRERAILAALALPGQSAAESEELLRELAELATTAGAAVVAVVHQRRDQPDPRYYLGEGKVEELHLLVHGEEADLLICDDELTPTQQRELEAKLEIRVIDRARLILDIFAQRARTKEAQLQVELAQLEYLLPRLTGRGVALSRLGGGIGTRGPGETKLEADRRRIRRRIAGLRRELAEIRKQRAVQRKERTASGLPIVALVGYTNAGKSTLLNRLTAAGVLAEDKLFATLDPTVRRFTLPSGETLLLVDTVGFIRKLPHELVAAFRATLEESTGADRLLHLIDLSNPGFPAQKRAVEAVLADLGVPPGRVIPVLNKVDLLPSAYQKERLRVEHPDSVVISALSGEGMEDLFARLTAELAERWVRLELRLPYAESGLIGEIQAAGSVRATRYEAEEVVVEAVVSRAAADRWRRYASFERRRRAD
ncbi:MAG: GTPase HflX [Bacillota bacterium]|nr:GTPase HflX [Bacillota bacterium]